jgi:hypothetical protein
MKRSVLAAASPLIAAIALAMASMALPGCYAHERVVVDARHDPHPDHHDEHYDHHDEHHEEHHD